MNLRDWKAMSWDERKRYWTKASEDEHQWLSQQMEHDPKAIELTNELKIINASIRNDAALKGNFMPARECRISAWLKSQVDDEIKAWADYGRVSDELRDIGQATLSDVLAKMSHDEFQHRLFLEAISFLLDETYHCGR